MREWEHDILVVFDVFVVLIVFELYFGVDEKWCEYILFDGLY